LCAGKYIQINEYMFCFWISLITVNNNRLFGRERIIAA
jgi:hypothetical protein